MDNLKGFGRIKEYKHSLSVNYTLPTKFIPGFDWIQSRVQYNSNFGWSSGSLMQIDTLGSVISNGQTIALNGEFNFSNLYNKIPYLKRVNSESEGTARRTPIKAKPNSNKDIGVKDKKKKEPAERKITMAEKIIVRPLMLVRRIQLNYSENNTTIIPGFMQRPELLGMNKGFQAPGWSFVAGLKPDIGAGGFLDEAASKGWITNNIFLNKEVIQRSTKVFGAKGRIELFKGFNLDLNIDRNYTRDHTETFKFDEVYSNPGQFAYQHLKGFENGQFSISYIAINTLFNRNIDTLFRDFGRNREIISKRVGAEYNINQPYQFNPNYTDGFAGDHQDVIINSFLATYSNKNPNTSKLDVFKTLPLPNWQLNYSGLSKLPFFRNIFQDFSIRHAYKNLLTMNSYRTNLDYQENLQGIPTARKSDSLANSYYSKFEIPEITVNESFSPLIGINIKTKGGLDLAFDVNKSRNLQMKSGIEGQLEERNSTGYTLRAGYVIKNVYLSFFKTSGSFILHDPHLFAD